MNENDRVNISLEEFLKMRDDKQKLEEELKSIKSLEESKKGFDKRLYSRLTFCGCTEEDYKDMLNTTDIDKILSIINDSSIVF